MNRSLILNAAWHIATQKDPYLSAILKAKYYPNTSFWLSKNSSTKSIFWSSILQIKQSLAQNCLFQTHKGDSSIWSFPWFPLWETIHDHLILPVTRPNLPHKVADLWHPHTRQWNRELITEIFSEQVADAITHIITVPSEEPDIIRWTPAAKGTCTAEDAFNFLNS